MKTFEALVVRSCIQTSLLSFILKRGALLGGSGVLLLIFGGTFLPLEILSVWGVPLFFIGMTLVTGGLLPYRKLNRLQLRPHEIHCDGKNLFFLVKTESHRRRQCQFLAKLGEHWRILPRFFRSENK